MNIKLKLIIKYIAVSAGIGIILFMLGFILAAGGHGTEVPSIFFFPWAFILYYLSYFFWDHTSILVTIMLLQYPLYGFLIGKSNNSRRRSIIIIIICLLHIGAFICAYLMRQKVLEIY